MAKWAHSKEVRERAVAAYESRDVSRAEIARIFGISESSLVRWQQQLKARGTLDPLPHRSGNKPRVDEKGAVVVRAIVAEKPDVTLDEAVIFFVERTNTPCSRASMGRAFQRLSLTRKKSP